jgi:hypothetical protein
MRIILLRWRDLTIGMIVQLSLAIAEALHTRQGCGIRKSPAGKRITKLKLYQVRRSGSVTCITVALDGLFVNVSNPCLSARIGTEHHLYHPESSRRSMKSEKMRHATINSRGHCRESSTGLSFCPMFPCFLHKDRISIFTSGALDVEWALRQER